MMPLAARTAALHRDFADRICRYGPAAAALAYPLSLALLHLSGQHFVRAPDAITRLLAGFALCLAAVLICSVPFLSFLVISRCDRPRDRVLAHLAFAAPPLFTLTGVAFFFLGVANGDYAIWAIAWLAVLAFAASSRPPRAAPAAAENWVRSAHAITGATIVVIFLLAHLANHAVAVASFDANKNVMELLRAWYRSGLVQPVLIALFAWQLVSGARLLWAKAARRSDLYASIQTATAAYLLVYIPSHLIAVFILGRWFLGVDTTFAWASGAPSGLLLDAWNVRLIAHYSFAVLFVIGHLAMGLRAVLLGHGVRVAAADRAAWIICLIGLAASGVIAVAQLRCCKS
jgi:hypothetical protein